MSSKAPDCVQRFLFEEHDIRGELVSLDNSWEQMIAFQDYPDAVSKQLGELVAATALLSSTLKYEGRLTAQVESSGPLRLMVVQCSDDLRMRGVARFDALDGAFEFGQLTRGGRLIITIDTKSSTQPYQGLVPLSGASLSDSLQQYFERSVQLPARLWLNADSRRASGMLLQRLPEDLKKFSNDDDAWNRVQLLAGTVTTDELANLPNLALLKRLFHEDNLRLFATKPVCFECSCSRDAMSHVLKLLGSEEVTAVLEDQGKVEVTCEFCNRAREFDAIDVATLMGESGQVLSSDRKH